MACATLHGLIWEWVDDFNALLVDGDSRKDGDPDKRASAVQARSACRIAKTMPY